MINLENLNLKRNLPLAGIVAFSLCSVWSLYHLLIGHAKHDTWLFWLPALLVELVTAWAVYQVVEQARKVTRSNISKQDRRFYALVLAAFVAVAVPTLAASIWANTLEFGGNLLLGSLFPTGSIGCAIGVALPDVVSRYEARKESDRKETEAKRKERKAEAERKRKAAEAEWKQEEMEAEAERKAAEIRRKVLASLGAAGQTLALYEANPNATQAEIAELADLSERTIRNHLGLLEAVGLVRRIDGNVEMVV